jgi:hypothetical protein
VTQNSWLEGNSVAQTVMTCLYAQPEVLEALRAAADRAADGIGDASAGRVTSAVLRALLAYVTAMLRTIGISCNTIVRAGAWRPVASPAPSCCCVMRGSELLTRYM